MSRVGCCNLVINWLFEIHDFLKTFITRKDFSCKSVSLPQRRSSCRYLRIQNRMILVGTRHNLKTAWPICNLPVCVSISWYKWYKPLKKNLSTYLKKIFKNFSQTLVVGIVCVRFALHRFSTLNDWFFFPLVISSIVKPVLKVNKYRKCVFVVVTVLLFWSSFSP